MIIYRIVEDVNKYQWVMPENDDDLDTALSFDCQSKASTWKDIDLYCFNPKKLKGDFYSLGGIGALVFNERVLDKMYSIFEIAGEILPLNLSGEKIFVLNVLQCVNCLDYKRTQWDFYLDGSKGNIVNYSFHTDRMTESSIFKIPETSSSEVLVFSGLKDEEDEFFYLYHKNNFTGLTFEKIF